MLLESTIPAPPAFVGPGVLAAGTSALVVGADAAEVVVGAVALAAPVEAVEDAAGGIVDGTCPVWASPAASTDRVISLSSPGAGTVDGTAVVFAGAEPGAVDVVAGPAVDVTTLFIAVVDDESKVAADVGAAAEVPVVAVGASLGTGAGGSVPVTACPEAGAFASAPLD